MIDTIFYFVNDYDTYQETRETEGISPRTIVFVAENKAIYKDGVRYGGYNAEEAKQQIDDEIDDKLPTVNQDITDIQTQINGINTALDNFLLNKAQDIINLIGGTFSTYSWLREQFSDLGWGQIFDFTGFKNGMKDYLYGKGLLDQDGSASWTSLTATLNDISGEVVRLKDSELSLAKIQQAINEKQITINLSTLWADLSQEAKDAILAGTLKQGALDGYLTIADLDALFANSTINTTFADFISNAEQATVDIGAWNVSQDEDGSIASAISVLRQKVSNNFASLDLAAKVNSLDSTAKGTLANALKLAGLHLEADTDSVVANLFATSTYTKQATEQLINSKTAGFLAEADLNNAVAKMYAEGTGNVVTVQRYKFVAQGTTETSPRVKAAAGTFTDGTYYSLNDLASSLYLNNNDDPVTRATTDYIKGLSNPFVVANSAGGSVLGYFILEVDKELELLQASIEVGVKNDSSFITAVASQVSVAANSIDITTDTNKHVKVDSNGIYTQTGSTTTNELKYDGSGSLAGGSIRWSSAGKATLELSDSKTSGGVQEHSTIKINAEQNVGYGSEPGIYVQYNTYGRNPELTNTVMMTPSGFATVNFVTDSWGDDVTLSQNATNMIRKDGSGFLASKNISWNSSGVLEIDTTQLNSDSESVNTKIKNGVIQLGKTINSHAHSVEIAPGRIDLTNASSSSYISGNVLNIDHIYSSDIETNTVSVSSNSLNHALTIESTRPSNSAADCSILIAAAEEGFSAPTSTSYNTTDAIITLNRDGGNSVGEIKMFANDIKFYADSAYFDCPVTYAAQGTSSDERLKDILEELTLSIQNIANVRIVNYKLKSHPERSPYVGTIAQDWQEILPNAIMQDKDGNLALNYEAVAVASAVTAAREIVALKEENAQLKARLAAIEERLGIVVE